VVTALLDKATQVVLLPVVDIHHLGLEVGVGLVVRVAQVVLMEWADKVG
jgi:hypothetical protein